LKDLQRYLDRKPVVSQFLRWERKRYLAATGANLDFSRAYWRGPLSAQSAPERERLQIERLGLRALVSLTDKDTIDAGLLLQAGRPVGELPTSVEWTGRYEQSYLHLGIHNLAPLPGHIIHAGVRAIHAQPANLCLDGTLGNPGRRSFRFCWT